MSTGHMNIFFVNCLLKSSYPFYYWVISYYLIFSSSYSLNTKPLLGVSSIFSMLFLHNLILSRHSYPLSPMLIHQLLLCFTTTMFVYLFTVSQSSLPRFPECKLNVSRDLVCTDPGQTEVLFD